VYYNVQPVPTLRVVPAKTLIPLVDERPRGFFFLVDRTSN